MQLTSHWQRHPWPPGERRLHWYLLPDASIYEAVERARQRIGGPEWDFVADEWLHCTITSLAIGRAALGTQGSKRLVDRVTEAVRALSMPLPLPAVVGVPHVFSEGLVWRLEPQAPIQALCRAVGRASAEFVAEPRPATFVPHITLAYPNAAVDAGPPLAVLQTDGDALPASEFATLHLLDVWRVPGRYCWDPVAEVSLEPSPRTT